MNFLKLTIRILDDLLPENSSQKRRHHSLQESMLRRLSTRKKDWDDDEKEVQYVKGIQVKYQIGSFQTI